MAGKRRLLKDMTPYERVDSRMRGMTWEEAEEVGIEVLARVLAYHVYVQNEGGDYLRGLMKRICDRADAWAHSDNGIHYLGMARFALRLKEREEKRDEA